VPKGIVDVSKGLAETDKIKVETELKRLQVEETRLDILEKAERLRQQRKISDKALRHKQEAYPQAIDQLRDGLLIVAPANRFAFLEISSER
jgi:hypothetical protein